MSSSLTERLSQHLLRPVDLRWRQRARLHLLDWLACVAAARRSAIAGCTFADAVEKAAFLGNVLEMDDVHRGAILHPGPVIWPSVLSGGGASFDAMLDAAIRGYEAMITIGATFDSVHYAHWHNTATAGSMGAAAAASALAGGDEHTLVAALGLAGSVSGGFWQMRHEPVMAKQWHVAHAVATGTAAARHARAGITGPRLILEGPQGLYAATCRDPRPMHLAGEWRLAEVSFKPWGACRHAHPAIDATLQLRDRGALGGDIVVETYADAIDFCDQPDPTSVTEAKFSLQHVVAIVAARGEPRLADFEPEAIAALAPNRARVRVREDHAFTARYPTHFGASVSASGERATVVDTLGDPERPLSRPGIIGKANALFDWGGIDRAEAEAIVAVALEGDDPRAVTDWLGRWL